MAFPLAYHFIPGQELRLHHSFTGLLLQLAPWKPVQCFGSAIAFDSALYFISEKRGYLAPSVLIDWRGKKYDGPLVIHNYDFMNTVVKNLPYIVTTLASMCLVERTMNFLTSKTKEKENKKEKEEKEEAKPTIENGPSVTIPIEKVNSDEELVRDASGMGPIENFNPRPQLSLQMLFPFGSH